VQFVLREAPLREAIILGFGSRKRTNRAIVSLTMPLRDSPRAFGVTRVCISIRVMKLSLIRRNSSCVCHVARRTSRKVSLMFRQRILARETSTRKCIVPLIAHGLVKFARKVFDMEQVRGAVEDEDQLS